MRRLFYLTTSQMDTPPSDEFHPLTLSILKPSLELLYFKHADEKLSPLFIHLVLFQKRYLERQNNPILSQ